MRFPRLQFGLKTLLVMIALTALLAEWGRRYYLLQTAKHEYLAAFGRWDQGTEADVFAASDAWLTAELAVPFVDRTNAAINSLTRAAGIEWKIRYHSTEPKRANAAAAAYRRARERAREIAGADVVEHIDDEHAQRLDGRRSELAARERAAAERAQARRLKSASAP